VLFEKGTADLFVDFELMCLNDILDSITIIVASTFLNGALEEFLVPIEGELIHGINLVQVV
jgi:hypothetical protein